MSRRDRLEAWVLEHGAAAGRVAGILGVLAFVAAVSVCSSGCATTAYGRQAQAAQLTTLVTGATGEALDAARDSALDAVEAEHPAHGPERTAALEAEAARWRPAGQALDALRELLVTWILAIEAARAIGDDGFAALWPRVLALAGQVAALYGRVAALARELGADGVPALPASVSGLLGGAQ